MLITYFIRFMLWITELVWCKLLRMHFPKTVAIRYSREIQMHPKMTRVVLRHVHQRCKLCGDIRARVDRARVAHDWQYPERLFKPIK